MWFDPSPPLLYLTASDATQCELEVFERHLFRLKIISQRCHTSLAADIIELGARAAHGLMSHRCSTFSADPRTRRAIYEMRWYLIN